MANSGSIWKVVGDGQWVGSEPSRRYPVYTRGNAGEVYPEVFTPLSFSIAAEPSDQAFRNAVARTGLVSAKDLAEPPDVGVGSGVFGGYAYLNLSLARLAAVRLPGGEVDDVDTQYMGAGDPPPYRPDPRDRDRRASLRGLRYLLRTLRATDVPTLRDDQRRVDDFLARLPDPADATDAQLRDDVDRLMPMFAELFENHLVVSGQAGLAVGTLTNLCDRFLGDARRAVALISGLGDVDSAAPSRGLWSLGRTVADSAELTAAYDEGVAGLEGRLRVAGGADATRFVQAFDDFLVVHGCRGPNEWDTAFDTWETDPSLALALVERLRLADQSHDPTTQAIRLARRRTEAESEAVARLRRPQRRIFRTVLRSARLFTQARERSKTTVVRAIHGVRRGAKELDRRIITRSGGRPGDLWYVTIDEIDRYIADPRSFRTSIAERRRMHDELARRIPPFFFEGRQPPLDTWELRDAEVAQVAVGDRLTGLPGCGGVARGRARIVTDPSDPAALGPGDVLVASSTDPSWTPLFIPAAAVVVDVGAVMSHAMIVSRELGIPCVASVTDATRRIPDGALVEVDGTAGTVEVLELPE